MSSLVYCILVGVLISHVHAECPNGWSRYFDSCYKTSHDTETWIDAMNICKLYGSSLVEINNVKENNYVTSLIIPGKVNSWIGASDLGIDGEWTWVGSRDDISYTNWAPGQPGSNGINENCMSMDLHGHWSDEVCRNFKPYVCERPASSGTELTGK